MKTLVVIPVYNEQRYVRSVLDEVRRYAKDILVIDDGSVDDTPLLLARQPVEVIRHAENRGYGRSLIDAFRWAQCYRFDWLITMDCDEQHEPASLPDFYRVIDQDKADVVSGSRYLQSAMDPSHRHAAGFTLSDPPADRRAINHIVTEQINRLLGLAITDAFCGFKAYRVSALKKLELDEPGYAFPLQFWVQSAVHDFSIVEIPIRLIYHDPTRSFGGPLDDADDRLAHYKQVFQAELNKSKHRFISRRQLSYATH